MSRLRVTHPQAVESITSGQDIVDIVRHAMEALQTKPKYPAGDRQLVFNELDTILDFLGSGQ